MGEPLAPVSAGHQVLILSGPNGAGKSTPAAFLVPEGVAFVNDDEIAKELSTAPTPIVELRAGRLMLERLYELGCRRVDFALETTLANRAFAPRIERLRNAGYRVHLFYLWLPSADLAVARVAERVRCGGHHVPEETIRRRYDAGLRNFLYLYRPIVDE
jgi:predicted ABC-type ATPase